MTDFKTIQMSGDVQGVIGKSADGSMRLQSVIFPRSRYSVNEATIRGYHMQKEFT